VSTSSEPAIEPVGTPAEPAAGVPAGALLAGSTAAAAVPDGAEAWLTPAERERAGALLRAGDRADYVAAHVLVRRCAALVLATTPDRLTVVQRCPECGRSGHGRPSVAEAPHVRLSLAHTRGYVAAIADTAEVAVDAERLTGRVAVAELAASVLTPSEQELVRAAARPELMFARIWVRKESLVKLGLATLDTLPDMDVSRAMRDTASWRGYAVLGWTDPSGQVVGAVVARRAPELVRFLD
jgi:4'-phosphopantetheinyl transferase